MMNETTGGEVAVDGGLVHIRPGLKTHNEREES